MKRLVLFCTLVFSFLLLSSLVNAETSPIGFFRYPTIGGGKIVFTSEGDLWSVLASGGVASRLTIHDGAEGFHKIAGQGK